jgi:hypothetical protein
MVNLEYNASTMSTDAGSPSPRQPWPFTSQRLADQLVALGVLPLEAVSAAVAEATATGGSLVGVLLGRGMITEEALRDAMAQVYGLPIAELDEEAIAEEPVAGFPAELARVQYIVPLSLKGDRLRIAVADPTRAAVLRDVHDIVGYTLDLELATPSALATIVNDVFSPRLSVKMPDGAKTAIILPLGDLKIGRAEHNELILREPGVSTTHAIIRGQGSVYQIIDLGSRNGVFVNGVRIGEAHPLSHGDKIQIGRATMKFTWPYQVQGDADAETAKSEKAAKKSERMRAAYIGAIGRIMSQLVGAAALITLGLLLSGGLPTSCSTVGETASRSTKATTAVSGVTQPPNHSSLKATVTIRALPPSRTIEYQSSPSRRTSRIALPGGTPSSR